MSHIIYSVKHTRLSVGAIHNTRTSVLSIITPGVLLLKRGVSNVGITGC